MDDAAGNGYFHLVLFLHAHRNEGCSFEAFRSAFRFGHLEILRWLMHNYPHLYDREALLAV